MSRSKSYKTSSLSLNVANYLHGLHSYASANGERVHYMRCTYRRTVCWL